MKNILSIVIFILGLLIGLNTNAKDLNMSNKNILVAYFSATGITEKLATRLAQAVEGKLFEIKPLTPYTSEDLNWHDKQRRSSVEMNDKSSRPKIASKLEDITQYDVIFVGFPIWWYREPSIIDTFIESYDFSGKVIVPFATSGMSGMGDCRENLQKLAPQAKVFEGKRFIYNISEEDLKQWADKWL